MMKRIVGLIFLLGEEHCLGSPQAVKPGQGTGPGRSAAVYYFNMGIELDNQGAKKAALTAYDVALKIDPRLFQAYVNKGEILLNLRKFDEAIQTTQKGLEINPKDYIGWNIIFESYKQLGFIEKSLNAAEKCLKEGPFRDCFLNRGHAFDRLRKYKDSHDAYASALKYFPNDETILENVILMSLKQWDLESAEREFPAFKKLYPKNTRVPHFEEAMNELRQMKKESNPLDLILNYQWVSGK